MLDKPTNNHDPIVAMCSLSSCFSPASLPKVLAGLICFTFFSLSVAVTSVHAGSTASDMLIGEWTGVDVQGRSVTYIFAVDGSAEIYENGTCVLKGGDYSRVSWSVQVDGATTYLDVVYSDDFGTRVVTEYIGRFEPDGTLVLKSGGPSGSRPRAVDDPNGLPSLRLYR